MEGDKFSGRTNSLDTQMSSCRGSLVPFEALQSALLLCLFPVSRSQFSPPWYFPLSHSVLFADWMFSLGFWKLGPGAVQGSWSSLADLVFFFFGFYLSLSDLFL